MKHHNDLRELQQAILDVALRRKEPEEVEIAIRESMEAAKSDKETSISLRLLLGELFNWTGERARARMLYRKLLKSNPDMPEALIAMGWTFIEADIGKARHWFSTACEVAGKTHDFYNQLKALDNLALVAAYSDDAQSLRDIYDRMCTILASDPRLEMLPIITAEKLIEEGQGQICLPFLKCLIRHMLIKGFPRRFFYFALKPLMQYYAKVGHSHDEILAMIDEFRSLTGDEAAACDFEIAIEFTFRNWLHK